MTCMLNNSLALHAARRRLNPESGNTNNLFLRAYHINVVRYVHTCAIGSAKAPEGLT